MPRIASLGMYDPPDLHDANDALWSAVAGRLALGGVTDVPRALDRSRPLDAVWDDPSLLLAQTCGYPLTTRWRGRLRYVATPRYRAPGCGRASHRSRVLVRQTDAGTSLAAFRGRSVAVNDRTSNTGMNLLRALVAPLAVDARFFGQVVVTGSHAESACAVVAGRADIAAIDGVTYAHLETAAPDVTDALRTLTWTAASPGLPLVTSIATSDRLLTQLRAALRETIADQANAAVCARLRLDCIAVLGARRYDVVTAIECASIRAGYPDLA